VNFLKKNFLELDRTMLLTILTLIGVGIILVYSSSFIFAIESRNDGYFFFKKQLAYSILGMVALFGAATLPFGLIRKYGFISWILFGVMICLTFIPGIGVRSGGAIRWIHLGGGVYIEPSEFLKISLPLLMSYLISKFDESPEKLKTFMISMLLFFPLPVLLKQPDFGSFAVCTLVIFSLLFTFGLRWFWVISGSAIASVSFYALVMQVPYRKARIMAFMDPWSAIAHGGYQVIQSLLSFYTGGLVGSGLGQGQGKLFFLPEAHTDFIFSVLGEETGFIGVMILFSIYGFLMFRAFQMTSRLKDLKAQVMAMGLCMVFTVQVLINLCVVFGLLPTKGLALPFLSYGGSSMIATCVLFGLLLNIQRTYLPSSR
jgi:cell division protein FtsW